MSEKLLVVSQSPHIYNNTNVQKLMLGVIIALLPAFICSVAFFGIGVIIITSISISTCVVLEYLIQKYLLKKEPSTSDLSAVLTGLLLAMNLPSNLPWWITIIGAAFSIGVAKMAFGGLGQNPFNPALAGRIFLLLSFPTQMTKYPVPLGLETLYINAATGPTPLSIIKEGLRKGEKLSEILNNIPDIKQLLIGKIGGSMGEVAALALILGLIYLLYKKIITWHIPISIITTIVVFSGILHFIDPEKYMNPLFHILTGGILLGAIFMATDYVTSPMTGTGMIIYGIGIGILTIIIRVFGAYPEGISFAILIMNGFVPLINRFFKPKRFGEVKNNG